MKNRLVLWCARMWMLGLVGMLVAHTVFGQKPDDLVCGLFAGAWGVGGTSFLVLGGLHVAAGSEK